MKAIWQYIFVVLFIALHKVAYLLSSSIKKSVTVFMKAIEQYFLVLFVYQFSHVEILEVQFSKLKVEQHGQRE